jgi:hypothetical protein
MFYAQPLIRWRLQLEEHGPKIVYIKGIHNIVADAISQHGYYPSANQTAECYCTTKVIKNSKAVRDKTGKQKVDTNKHEDFNLMFSNHGKEDEIYPLRTKYNL